MSHKNNDAKRALEAQARARARAYIAEVRAVTVCAKCGAQPVDFHRKEHDIHHNRRVSRMVGAGFPNKSIAAEIRLCTPLCRQCHMQEDGRLEVLLRYRRDNPMKGEQNPAAVLTMEQVAEIRRIHAETGESKSSLARKYGVTQPAIRYIIMGKTWKEQDRETAIPMSDHCIEIDPVAELAAQILPEIERTRDDLSACERRALARVTAKHRLGMLGVGA